MVCESVHFEAPTSPGGCRWNPESPEGKLGSRVNLQDQLIRGEPVDKTNFTLNLRVKMKTINWIATRRIPDFGKKFFKAWSKFWLP